MELSQLADCTRCSLRAHCGQVVRGCGQGDVMVVADFPDEEDDLIGEPFSGRAGQHTLLLLKRVSIDYHITYVVKCWPKKDRVPNKVAVATCKEWLFEEIRWYAPKAIITLGKISAHVLLGTKLSVPLKNIVGKCKRLGTSRTLVAPWYGPNTMLRGSIADSERAVKFFSFVKDQSCLNS